MEAVKSEKNIGNYQVKFVRDYSKKDSDFINLRISISDDLKDLLKQVTIGDVKDFSFDGMSYERYRVQNWLYGSLYSSYKEILFIKGLVDKGEAVIKSSNVKDAIYMINSVQQNFKQLIEAYKTYNKFDVTINYSVKENKEQ